MESVHCIRNTFRRVLGFFGGSTAEKATTSTPSSFPTSPVPKGSQIAFSSSVLSIWPSQVPVTGNGHCRWAGIALALASASLEF